MKTRYKVLLTVVVFLGLAWQGFGIWLRANGQAFYMPSGSMAPTLPIGARVLGMMHAYDSAPPHRGDIALMDLPGFLYSPGTGAATATFVKRVVGVPGDLLEIKRGVLTRGGIVQSEPFANWSAQAEPRYDLKIQGGQVFLRDAGGEWMCGEVPVSPQQQKQLNTAPSQPIPPDEFFVLGDNRGNSNDSHIFGLVPRAMFKGRVSQQFWPRVRSF